MPLTKSQRDSQLVFQQVQQLVGNSQDREQKKYKSLCKRAGGLLRTMGLLQFLVYLQAKGSHNNEEQHLLLLDQLRVTLKTIGTYQGADNSEDFRIWVTGLAVPHYMRVTRDILSLLNWHKQFADIMIAGNADNHEENE